jgi:methyl-accepting chemotaxis protein
MPQAKEQDEYELIPLSPLRRLEKRIEELETAGPGINVQEIFKEVLDIVRMNQELVDELAKANDALRIEISKLPAKMDDLINNLNELISFIRASATEEVSTGESFKPIVDKLDELIQANKKIAESNQTVLNALEEMDRKMRKPLPSLPPIKRPLLLPPRIQ